MVLVQEGEKLLDDRQDLLHQLVTALSLHDQLERDTEARVRPEVACQRRADVNLSMRRSTKSMNLRMQVASTVVGDSKTSRSPASDIHCLK